MPMGKGTYGSKVGRPKKKRKEMMGGGRMYKKHGGPAGHDGNKHARREYKHGGEVMPKAKPC